MNNIYLALDFPTWQETNKFLVENDLQGVPVKVGMELFYREGPLIIEKLKANGHAIFLDLKLHDIPTTVYRAMKNISQLEVDIINVHALGGMDMMKWAKEGLLSGASDQHETTLIAVTILTSFDQLTFNKELLINGELEENAVHFAKMSKNCGVDGVVCSVHEANKIKKVCGNHFLTVTPGIRLENGEINDQKRIATPQFARENGADILVIGRSITKANEPLVAYKKVLEEWK